MKIPTMVNDWLLEQNLEGGLEFLVFNERLLSIRNFTPHLNFFHRNLFFVWHH